MVKDISFGVSVKHKLAMDALGNFDADGYADIIASVEQLCYDFVVAPDHVFVPPYWAEVIGDVFFEALTLFGYLAARTSQIGLVFACVVVPYRQPFTTAKSVVAVDQLARGRFSLGVVPGYLKEEFQTFGLPRDACSEMTNEPCRTPGSARCRQGSSRRAQLARRIRERLCNGARAGWPLEGSPPRRDRCRTPAQCQRQGAHTRAP